MQFALSNAVQPSRASWSEYSLFYERPISIPKIHRIVLNDYVLPVLDDKIRSLAIVVNSNLGYEGNVDRNLYCGNGVKQFLFNRDSDGKWKLFGSNLLEYPSASMEYRFRLRYQDQLGKFIDFPRTPKRVWEIKLTLV